MLLGLGGVAFITLLERKYLGLTQVRLGPNKLTLIGVLQPVGDGVKLLFKELFISLTRYKVMFIGRPLILFILFTVTWIIIIPWWGFVIISNTKIIMFFIILGVSAYAIILAGWNIISRFSKLGGLRGILQSLSYEVALILVLLCLLIIISSLRILGSIQISVEMLLSWLVLWFLLSIIETNRAPFDLLEGERELISGFNVEIGRILFVFLFLSEYGIIIVISLIRRYVIITNATLLALVIRRLILFSRSCYPRVRYDSLIGLIWQSILPVSLMFFYVIQSIWV